MTTKPPQPDTIRSTIDHEPPINGGFLLSSYLAAGRRRPAGTVRVDSRLTRMARWSILR